MISTEIVMKIADLKLLKSLEQSLKQFPLDLIEPIDLRRIKAAVIKILNACKNAIFSFYIKVSKDSFLKLESVVFYNFE